MHFAVHDAEVVVLNIIQSRVIPRCGLSVVYLSVSERLVVLICGLYRCALNGVAPDFLNFFVSINLQCGECG